MKRIAAIDIGTNSVLLTIAEKRGGKIVPIHEAATITRLGEGLAKTGRLGGEPIERTLKALAGYANICKKFGVEKIYTVGTFALRKAENGGEFIGLARERLGLDIEIISGEREAELAYAAVREDFGPDVIIVDIGGGSTEFVIAGLPTSIGTGCVTLHEKYVRSDPISDEDFDRILSETKRMFADIRQDAANLKLVATAGTATTLAAMKLGLKKYNHAKVHGFTLTKHDIEEIISTLRKLRVSERKKLPGLQPGRADVILPGAMILRAVMETLGFDTVTVSDRGVRWGLIGSKL